jgi:hypothetical protein
MVDTDGYFFARLPCIALSAYGTFPHTLEAARQCIRDGIPGDFVECGVGGGAHPALMARACMEAGVKRKIHLFDSFEGIPEAGPRDDESITACVGVGKDRLVTTGVAAYSLERVRSNLVDYLGLDESLFVFHPGWFQKTVSTAARTIESIAILRLDCDLYSSTMACLPSLYPKLAKGGYYISDDYTLTGAKCATEEYMASIAESVTPLKVGDGDGCWYWRR